MSHPDLHKVEAENIVAKQAICHDLLDAVENDNLIHHVLSSDEATLVVWVCEHTQL